MWAKNISNALLESKTLEKFYIVSWTLFGDMEDRILIVNELIIWFLFLWTSMD